MRLHGRGVELVVEMLEAAESVENMQGAEIGDLLREAAEVMGELLARDAPEQDSTRSDLPAR